MDIDIIEDMEERVEINLDWFYHSVYYDKEKYSSILTDGIKCNELLHKPGCGVYNGKYYISLSKITIPDNQCFRFYATLKPSFIIHDIEPIKCVNISEYEQYINTEDPRRMGNYDGEYQYYYFIQNTCIIGIVYNLLEMQKRMTRFDKNPIIELIKINSLLEELNINIPIYDYSRRDKTLVHEIDKEKINYYSRKLKKNNPSF